MDIELGGFEGGMGDVLSPFSLSKTTIKATGGPIGDTVDDTVWRIRVTNGKNLFPHLNSKRFATIGNFFPSSDFISDRFTTRSGGTVGITVMTGVNSRKTSEKSRR